MRITLISRSWPPFERSGVSLSAFSHARILLKQGHEVSIIGAMQGLDAISLSLTSRVQIPASGSGALYSPVQLDKNRLKQVLSENKPDLVIVEAWQTALTDSAIEIASELHIPILMISHGISLHPYENSLSQFLRSIAWLPYRIFKLPRLMKKLSAITTLDDQSTSNRFADRDLAKGMGVPLAVLKNFPAHEIKLNVPRVERKTQILVIGYFSSVKNQLAAIQLLSRLENHISCRFIGDRQGRYFEACQKLVSQLKLQNRISFLQDDECNIAQEIAESLLVFSPSITEALPMTLIEAMACGTPFVATSVGAVSSFKGGILANTADEQLKALQLLIDIPEIWETYSVAGEKQYQADFTEAAISIQLTNAIDLAAQWYSNIKG